MWNPESSQGAQAATVRFKPGQNYSLVHGGVCPEKKSLGRNPGVLMLKQVCSGSLWRLRPLSMVKVLDRGQNGREVAEIALDSCRYCSVRILD